VSLRSLTLILTLLSLLLPLQNLYGQRYDIRTYSVNEGLPSGQVGDMAEGKKGMFWLGTATGLVRFDGHHFHNFTTENGLKDNYIYDVYLDSENRFWVSTETGGVAIFETDSLRYLPEFEEALSGYTVTYMIESPNSEMWFGTYENGIYIKNEKGFKHFGIQEGLPDSTIWDIHFDAGGTAWIATMNGVSVYDGDTFKNITTDDGLSGLYSYSIMEDSNGAKWVATSNGVSIIKGERIQTITEINGKKLNYVYDLIEDEEGKIWIGTERDGVYIYDGSSYEHITKQNGLNSNYIYRFYEDRKKDIWILTDENGISTIANRDVLFYGREEGLNSNSVLSVLEDEDGNLWVGTDYGLNLFDISNNRTFTPSRHLQDYNDEVWLLRELPDGNIIFANADSQILSFDGNSFHDFGKSINLPWVVVYDLLVDRRGILWIGTDKGLGKVTGENFKWATETGEIKGQPVWDVFEDSKGRLWAAHEKGLSFLNDDEFNNITFDTGETPVYVLAEDEKGQVWAGTKTGIAAVDEKERSALSFDLPDPFLKESLILVEDGYGGLWQGTNAGLNYFDIGNYHKNGTLSSIHLPFKNYGKGVESIHLSSLRDSKNRIWIGTADAGLIEIQNKDKFEPEPVFPPAIISQKAGTNEIYHAEQSFSVDYSEQLLTLNHRENNVTFSYSAVDFIYPEKVHYQYKLEGFDDDNWKLIYGTNQVTYTNLPPGEYSFLLKAKPINAAGFSETVRHSFKISAPFWQTTWFYLISALLTLSAGYGLLKLYLNNINQKKLERLVDEQTKKLTDALDEKEILIKEIHHRVKNNMAVVSGLLELQTWTIQDEKAKQHLYDSQMRIKAMSIIHEKLYKNRNFSKVNFKTYVKDLIDVIAHSQDNHNLRVEFDLEIEPVELVMTQAIPAALILNELVSNSYEHAFPNRDKGTVQVHFSRENGDIHFMVRDDGIGIKEKNIVETNSLGISLVKTLVEQLKGEVKITGEEGTVVCIKFPHWKRANSFIKEEG